MTAARGSGSTIFFVVIVLLVFSLCNCILAAKPEMHAVLCKLYNSVTTKDPTLRWSQDTDFCEWDGIKCDTQGLISELSLDYAHKPINNDLLIHIPLDALHTLRVLSLKGFSNAINFTGLFHLTELRELNFEESSFKIDVSAPEWTTQLSSLETLDLRTDSPQEFLGGWIYCHPSLKTLRIMCKTIEVIERTCNNTVLQSAIIDVRDGINNKICDAFTNIRELELDVEVLECVPSSVEILRVQLPSPMYFQMTHFPQRLHELRIVCAFHNQNSIKVHFPSTLEILEVNSCRFEKGISISNENAVLQELRLINIGYRSWTDIDSLIGARKPHLEVIDVSNNRIEGKLPDLTKLPQLKHFNISGNQIVDQMPSFLNPKLTVLDLSRNNFNGSIPTSICQSSALEHLILFSNGLTGSIPSCLGEALPNLRTVLMHTNSLTGSIPQSLFLYPKLHTLNLAFNGLSGTLPDKFEASNALFDLQLTRNKFQGRVPSVLPKQLSILDLSYNEFTGQLIGSTFKNLSLVTMKLNNNQLEGSIPKELFTMPQLKHLDLSTNQLSGAIPQTLSDNTVLTYLALAENKLNGTIPSISCPCEELYLNNNKLSGSVPMLSSVLRKAIDILDIGANQLMHDIYWSFSELRFLRISNNNFTSVHIEATDLLELDASNNAITMLTGSTPKLQVMDVSNNQISNLGILSQSLIHVDLSGNRLTNSYFVQASRMPYLRYFNLSRNALLGIVLYVDVVGWPLETLDVSHNQMNIEFPFKVQDRFSQLLRHLRNLYLNDNQIYGRISEMDTALVARLHVLNLANNQMYGKMDAVLLGIVSNSKLSALVLNGNRGITIEREDLKTLMSHSTLSRLSLSHCSVGDLSADFSALNVLEVLELAGCGLSGEIPTETLRRLRLLRQLDLSSNDFTGMPSSEVWESLGALEHIDLSGNPNLEGVLPTELSQSGLRYIDVSNTKLSGSLPLIRSNVINVARFANCSFSGFVDQLSIKDQMAEFDISNNQLRTFHSGWNAFSCINDSISNNNKQPFAKKCNMRGNDFQCYAFPQWTIDCCGAVCSYTEEVAYAISGSILALLLLVIAVAMTLYYGRRYLTKRRNEKSLEHLERSLLADAFDSVEHDMMISWSDINFIAKIGEGAFGVVYKGLYKGTEVAVKSIKSSPTASLTASSTDSVIKDEYRMTLNELITEVRFLMKLKHPYIVLLMGASIDKGRMAIVLEYMHHGSLHDLLHKSKSKNMDWMTKCRIAHQIASGMQYLHLQTPPVIHRDLKSMNILIDKNMTAKITDFGFSRENGATSMTSMVGTISYMAPEMFGQTDDLSSTSSTSTSSTSTKAVYDTTCDVYSFGILLWELLTEQIPWHNCSQPMLIASVLNGSRPPIPRLDTLTVAHHSQMNTPTDAPDVEMMDSDSSLLLDFNTTDNNSNAVDATSTRMRNSNLTGDIERYIEVMKQCWAQNPRERPNFSTITKSLEALLA